MLYVVTGPCLRHAKCKSSLSPKLALHASAGRNHRSQVLHDDQKVHLSITQTHSSLDHLTLVKVDKIKRITTFTLLRCAVLHSMDREPILPCRSGHQTNNPARSTLHRDLKATKYGTSAIASCLRRRRDVAPSPCEHIPSARSKIDITRSPRYSTRNPSAAIIDVPNSVSTLDLH